jgi:hypothetical protein
MLKENGIPVTIWVPTFDRKVPKKFFITMPYEVETSVIIVWLLMFWDVLNLVKSKIGTNILNVFIARLLTVLNSE